MSEYDDQLTIRQQRSALANMEQTTNDLRRELAAAVERERVLREICSGIVQREWDAYLTQNGAFLPACDYCRSARTYGHTVDCLIGRLAAALASAQPAISGEDEAYALDDLKAEYRSLTR